MGACRQHVAVALLQVQFAAIPDDVVDKLVADKATYSCAGGLMVEHPLVNTTISSINITAF